MAELVKREYEASLSDLTFNSKPLINMLTMLAEENVKYAPQIVEVIEARLQKAKPSEKLPVLYLMDSVIKNMKSCYLEAFTPNIVQTFCGVFEKVDEKTRQSLFKLRMTWSSFFPPKKLYAMDLKVKELDPAWPVVADPTASQHSAIHVNPKFIKKPNAETPKPAETKVVPSTPTAALTAVAEAELKKKESERQEMEMRQQLIKKQEQLLQLQQKRLEFELQQTQSKLEEQALELKQKNEQLLLQQQALHHQAAAAATWPGGMPVQPPMWSGGPQGMPGHGPPMVPQGFMMPPFNPALPMPPTSAPSQQQLVTPPMQSVLPVQLVPPVQQGIMPVSRDPRIARDPRLARRDPRLRGIADQPAPAAMPPTPVAVAAVPPVQSKVQEITLTVTTSQNAVISNAPPASATSNRQLKSTVTIAPSQPVKSVPKSPKKADDVAKDKKPADSKQQGDVKKEAKPDEKKDSKPETKPQDTKVSVEPKPKSEGAAKQEKPKETKSSERSPRRSSDEKHDTRGDSKSRDKPSREPERRTSRDSKKDFDKRDSWSSRERDRDRLKDRLPSSRDLPRIPRRRSNRSRSRSRSRSPVSRSRSPRGSDRNRAGARRGNRADEFGRDIPRPAKETKEEKKSEAPKKDIDDRSRARRTSKEILPEPKEESKSNKGKSEKRRSPSKTLDKDADKQSETKEEAPSKRPRLDEERFDAKSSKEENKPDERETKVDKKPVHRLDNHPMRVNEGIPPLMPLLRSLPRCPPRPLLDSMDWTKDQGQVRPEGRRPMVSPGGRDRGPRRRLSIDPSVSIPKELSLEKHAFILKQAEKQLHSGELTHREHQELLKQLYNLHQFQRQQQDDQHIDHPLDPRHRKPYPGDPRNSHDPRHTVEKDIDHRRFPVQDIDMRVFDPSHPRIGSESSGKETTGSESETIDQMPVGDKDERKRAAVLKDRDDRVRDVPGEKQSEHPSAPLKSILKTKKPVLESPMSPEPEEQKGNDSKVKTVGEATSDATEETEDSKEKEPVTLTKGKEHPDSNDAANPQPETAAAVDNPVDEASEKVQGKKKKQKKKKKSKGSEAEVQIEITQFEENLEIKPPTFDEKKIQPLMDMDERRNSTDNEPVNVLPAPFREADDIEELFPAGRDRDERRGPHGTGEGEHLQRPFQDLPPGSDPTRESHPKDPRLRKTHIENLPRDRPPGPDSVRDGPFRDGPYRDGMPRDHPYRSRFPQDIGNRDSPPRDGRFRDGPLRGDLHRGPPLRSPPRELPFRDRPLREGPPREGVFRDSPPREGLPREAFHRDHPPREGPFRNNLPGEGAFRDGPPRDGPFRDGPRDGSFRDGPPREGHFRDGPPRNAPFRDDPRDREGHFRDSPTGHPREGPMRAGPGSEGPFRDGPHREGRFREDPYWDGPFHEDHFREGHPRERGFRDGHPPRDGPPPRDVPFGEGVPRNGPFREMLPPEGHLRGQFRDGPQREGPVREGHFREGPPREGSFRRSPPRDEQFREGDPRHLPRGNSSRHPGEHWDPRQGPPSDIREERFHGPQNEPRMRSLIDEVPGRGIHTRDMFVAGQRGPQQLEDSRNLELEGMRDRDERQPPNQELPVQLLPPQPTQPPMDPQHIDGPQAPGSHPQHMAVRPGVPHHVRLPMHQGPPGLDAVRHLQPSMFSVTSVPMNVPRADFIGIGQQPHLLQQQQAPMLLPGLQGLNIPRGLGGNPGQFLGPQVICSVPQPGQMINPGLPIPAMAGAPHIMHADNPRGTPPQQGGQLDVNSLFAKLVATGILPSTRSDSPMTAGTGTPPPVAPQEGFDVNAAQSDLDEDLMVPELGLYPEELKCRYEGVINRIYTGTQCSSCGMRFVIDEMDRYRKHLDWHFRQNRREKDGVKAVQSRKWFYEVDQWLDFEEINEMDEERSSFFEEMTAESKADKDGILCVAIDGNIAGDEMCSLCHEPFEQFFDEEEEVWKLRDAVRFNSRTYHPSCFEDAKDSSLLETPTQGEEGLGASFDPTTSPFAAISQQRTSTTQQGPLADKSVDPVKDSTTSTVSVKSENESVDQQSEVKTEESSSTTADHLNDDKTQIKMESSTQPLSTDQQVDPQRRSSVDTPSSVDALTSNSVDTESSTVVKEEPMEMDTKVDQPMEMDSESTDVKQPTPVDSDIKTEPCVDPQVKMEVESSVADSDNQSKPASATEESMEVTEQQPVKLEIKTEDTMHTSETVSTEDIVIKQEPVDDAESNTETAAEAVADPPSDPTPVFQQSPSVLIPGLTLSATPSPQLAAVKEESPETLPSPETQIATTEPSEVKPTEVKVDEPCQTTSTSEESDPSAAEAGPSPVETNLVENQAEQKADDTSLDTKTPDSETINEQPNNTDPESQPDSQPDAETSKSDSTEDNKASELDTNTPDKVPSTAAPVMGNIQQISVIGSTRLDPQRRRDMFFR